MEPTDQTGERPPAQPVRSRGPGFVLFVLGLAITGIANAPGLEGDPGPTLRWVGTVGYVVGLLVAGLGVHRVLWIRGSLRRPAVRVLITAIVTFPAFLIAGIAVGTLMTLIQARSPF